MNFTCLTVLFVLIAGEGIHSRKYSPCSLARHLYELLEKNDKVKAIQEIPLLVCVAGYQHFDMDYFVENVASNDGCCSSIQGIFGLSTKHISQFGQLGNDVLARDLHYFITYVLHLDDAFPHPNLQFYRTLCAKSHVRELSCRLNDYVLMNYKVYEPLTPSLLDDHRRKPFFSDGLPFISSFTTGPEMSETVVTHVTNTWEPLLFFIIFWMLGSIFYVMARYAYDYLHFKYLRNIIALG